MVKTGYTYHHIGLPTTEIKSNEDYNPEWKFYGSGYFESQFGIEWLRFEHDTPIHPLIQSTPHVAFVVEDLQNSIKGQNVIYGPNSPADGVVVCFIEVEGAPIELLQFDKAEQEVWPNPRKRIHPLLGDGHGKDLISYQYHHFEIVTDEKRENRVYHQNTKSYSTKMEDHPFGIQWVTYTAESHQPTRIKENSMIVFSVLNLNEAIKGQNIVRKPYWITEGVLTAIISENGAMIRLVEGL
ncbi:MAG: hypothetical protein P1U56_03145 [Saprospiraceae bacterium]|nr:hypothetical protein [Saprospiraceae bacterium]